MPVPAQMAAAVGAGGGTLRVLLTAAPLARSTLALGGGGAAQGQT